MEEKDCRFFSKFREECYPHILHMYKSSDEYYPEGSFVERTGGDGNTESFRHHLKEFIHSFDNETLISGKPYKLILNDDGQFLVINVNTGKEETDLNETERAIYHYLCFINIAKFWQEFEIMRDLNVNLKPLIVQDFLEHLDTSVDINRLLNKAKELKRKVILVI